MTQRVLDRRIQFDEKSRQYPIRTLLDTTQPRSYTWRCDTYLDQGVEGACVGFAFAHDTAATPKPRTASNDFARRVYGLAKTLDPWDGEDYDGTSVLAGAKALKQLGLITQYRWAFTTTETLAAASRKGPVILGVNWREGMWDTDVDGYINPVGKVVGGHAILLTGVNVKSQYVTLHNSWGPGWGVGGKARLSWAALDILLEDDGEACIPVGRV